ncbi:WAS/WASL-interacting protein family member 2-like [Ixodes scapularis]
MYSLGSAKVFTTLDCSRGFLQIHVAPDDVQKTAFTCHRRLFEFTRLPFGLSNSQSSFQRLMDIVLGDAKFSFAMANMDDVVVFSNPFEEHLTHLEIVLSRMWEAGLTINPDKTDASDYGVGAVLLQEHDGQLRPVASASHRAGTPQSGSGPPARGGPGSSRPLRPARLPSRKREGPSPQGGRAWSRRPCHTVATWTTWDGQRDLHFVSRQRWRDQPRPVHDTPGVEVPPPFLGHTLPAFELAPDLQDPCWLCRVPVVHRETHEASPRHQELLRAVGHPTCVEAALRLVQRDRPDLLAPAARELPEEGATSAASTAAASTAATAATAVSDTLPPPLVPLACPAEPLPPPPPPAEDTVMAELEEFLAGDRPPSADSGPPGSEP